MLSSEIDNNLKGIHKDSTRGPDGLNSYFFKKVWHFIKVDVYKVINYFYSYSSLCRSWNCTNITLFPKSIHASIVAHYRPISWGFIPNRHNLDNVILASELVKGYGRKGMSPKCCVKIDLRKAYNFVEMCFVESVSWSWGFLVGCYGGLWHVFHLFHTLCKWMANLFLLFMLRRV